MRQNEYVIDIGITDLNGVIKFDTSGDKSVYGLVLKDLQPSTWKRFIEQNYDSAMAYDISYSVTTQKNSIIVMAGIKSDNQSIGILYAMLDWDKIMKQIMSNINLDKGADFSIISDTLEIIGNKDDKLIKTKADNSYNFINKNRLGYETIKINNEKTKVFYSKLNTQSWYTTISISDKQVYLESNKMLLINIIIGVLGIISLFIFIYLFAKSITNPLKYILEESKMISQGNLKGNLPENIKNRKDELGEMSKYFSQMQIQLSDIISSINETSDLILQDSSQMFNGNENLSRRVEESAASLEETASSMEEFSSGIKNSTENSKEFSEIMKEANKSIQQASSIISMTTKNIEEVNESSTKIKDITKMIEDIAFQTNILALNAAVEAARAGEQGKGFAVVASEVRNLAQNSQSSVKEITGLIDDSVEKINKATDSVIESREIFSQLEEKIKNASNLLAIINSTMEEQAIGVQEVNIAISRMDNVTQQNANLASEATELAKELQNNAYKLKDKVSYFNN